jgi:hypothetical protein
MRSAGRARAEAQREAGVPAHRRVADRHVAAPARADLRPVRAASARHHDGVAAVGVEDPEHVGGLEQEAAS